MGAKMWQKMALHRWHDGALPPPRSKSKKGKFLYAAGPARHHCLQPDHREVPRQPVVPLLPQGLQDQEEGGSQPGKQDRAREIPCVEVSAWVRAGCLHRHWVGFHRLRGMGLVGHQRESGRGPRQAAQPGERGGGAGDGARGRGLEPLKRLM